MQQITLKTNGREAGRTGTLKSMEVIHPKVKKSGEGVQSEVRRLETQMDPQRQLGRTRFGERNQRNSVVALVALVALVLEGEE